MGAMLSPGWEAGWEAKQGAVMPGAAARILGWLSGWLSGRMRVLHRRRAGHESPLRMEARLSLGPKTQLALVNCCGRKLLLGLSGGTITPLMEVPARRQSGRSREATMRSGGEQ